MIPFDTRSPFVTSGMRLGTAAVTTRGMKEEDMKTIASLIDRVLSDHENEEVIKTVRGEVNALMANFPLYK